MELGEWLFSVYSETSSRLLTFVFLLSHSRDRCISTYTLLHLHSHLDAAFLTRFFNDTAIYCSRMILSS